VRPFGVALGAKVLNSLALCSPSRGTTTSDVLDFRAYASHSMSSSSGPLCLSHVARLRCEGGLYRLLRRFDLGFPVDVRAGKFKAKFSLASARFKRSAFLVSEIGWPIKLSFRKTTPTEAALGSPDRPSNTDAFNPRCLARWVFCITDLYKGSFAESRRLNRLIPLTKNASENRVLTGEVADPWEAQCSVKVVVGPRFEPISAAGYPDASKTIRFRVSGVGERARGLGGLLSAVA